MNAALTFLETNRARLRLDRYGVGRRMTSVVVTPRFRASRHVVFLVLSETRPDPVLVVKVPRLTADRRSIVREAEALRAVQQLRPRGFESIPRVVACEPFDGQWMLVETALAGRAMDPAAVRRRRAACCNAVLDWIVDVETARSTPASGNDGPFESLISQPLGHLREALSKSTEAVHLTRRSRAAVEPLRDARLPVGFEHGDLSHPNLIVSPSGQTGVIDWELARQGGLPIHDLFFFLTYAALATAKSRSAAHCIRAFDGAFFGRAAWARRYTAAYANRHRLPAELLTPLLIACWARRVAGLSERLRQAHGSATAMTADDAAWLQNNRYYLLWKHTLDHVGRLHWLDVPPA